MIVDSSAIIAILFDEPEAAQLASAVLAQPARMSVATWLECHVVLDRRVPHLLPDLEAVVDTIAAELVDVTVSQGQVARHAHRRFGIRSGSPARLNFGDCFAYALAITTGEPLLFKGEDFTHTDVAAAWLPDA